jgi:hypothetical protein
LIDELVFHLKKAQEIATKNGFTNILQPGLVKEILIADILGHEVHKTKHLADAYDEHDPSIQYEYLTAVDHPIRGFQLASLSEKNMKRITRNAAFFFAAFDLYVPLQINYIYRIETPIVEAEVRRQISVSKNNRMQFYVTPKWVKAQGIKIYPLDV